MTPVTSWGGGGYYSAMRILVVDDDRSIAAALDLLLRDIGLHVDIAFSVAEARTQAASGGYDLLVLDLNLPEWQARALYVDPDHLNHTGARQLSERLCAEVVDALH